jgi:hypothetical protein
MKTFRYLQTGSAAPLVTRLQQPKADPEAKSVQAVRNHRITRLTPDYEPEMHADGHR